MTSQTKKVGGSIRNKITATELLDERNNCDFDKGVMAKIFWHDMSIYKKFQDEGDLME